MEGAVFEAFLNKRPVLSAREVGDDAAMVRVLAGTGKIASVIHCPPTPPVAHVTSLSHQALLLHGHHARRAGGARSIHVVLIGRCPFEPAFQECATQTVAATLKQVQAAVKHDNRRQPSGEDRIKSSVIHALRLNGHHPRCKDVTGAAG
jgi:hypothetical protein